MIIMTEREKNLTMIVEAITGGRDMGTVMVMSLIMGDLGTKGTLAGKMKEREVDMKVHEELLV